MPQRKVGAARGVAIADVISHRYCFYPPAPQSDYSRESKSGMLLEEAHVDDSDRYHVWATGSVPRGSVDDRPSARGPTVEGGISGSAARAARQRRPDRWRLPRLQHDTMAAAVIAPAD